MVVRWTRASLLLRGRGELCKVWIHTVCSFIYVLGAYYINEQWNSHFKVSICHHPVLDLLGELLFRLGIRNDSRDVWTPCGDLGSLLTLSAVTPPTRRSVALPCAEPPRVILGGLYVSVYSVRSIKGRTALNELILRQYTSAALAHVCSCAALRSVERGRCWARTNVPVIQGVEIYLGNYLWTNWMARDDCASIALYYETRALPSASFILNCV